MANASPLRATKNPGREAGVFLWQSSSNGLVEIKSRSLVDIQ